MCSDPAIVVISMWRCPASGRGDGHSTEQDAVVQLFGGTIWGTMQSLSCGASPILSFHPQQFSIFSKIKSSSQD